MMMILRTTTRNTERLSDSELAGAEVPAAGASNSHSAFTTFSNPFGLGQRDFLAEPTVGGFVHPVRKGNGMP